MWETKIEHCCASVLSLISMGQEKKNIRRMERTCITTLRSAFPVRISYSVNVRSEPILARTDDSLKLKRTAVIVSVEVGKVRFDIGALLIRYRVRDRFTASCRYSLCFVPYLNEVGSSGK